MTELVFLYPSVKPKSAKKLHFDVIPKTVDDYLSHYNSYSSLDKNKQYDNPIWHIHSGKPKEFKSEINFNTLTNLVNVSNSKDKKVIWSFINKYDDTDNIICIQGVRDIKLSLDKKNFFYVDELGLLIITNLKILKTLSNSFSLKGTIIFCSIFKFLWALRGDFFNLSIEIKNLKYDLREAIFLLIDLFDKPFSDSLIIHFLMYK